MKKLIFEDTTVIKKPFVEIDGVEYEVQDGEFEGGTDLNAQNFNQVQDNIEDYIDGETSMGSITVEDIECKNLLDVYFLSSGYINADGLNVEDTANGRGNNYIEVKPNTTYILSANTTIFGLRLNEYDENKNNIIQTIKNNTNQLTITTSSTTKYLRWSLNYDKSTSITVNLLKSIKFQLEKGSVVTDYVEHKEFSNKKIYTSTEQIIGTWIDGKVLYRKVVDIGYLPNNTSKSINSGVTNEAVVNIYGLVKNTLGYCLPLPHVNVTNLSAGVRINYTEATHTVDITTAYDMTEYSGWVVIEYTKKETNAVAEQTNQTTTSTTSTTNNGNLELTDM